MGSMWVLYFIKRVFPIPDLIHYLIDSNQTNKMGTSKMSFKRTNKKILNICIHAAFSGGLDFVKDHFF